MTTNTSSTAAIAEAKLMQIYHEQLTAARADLAHISAALDAHEFKMTCEPTRERESEMGDIAEQLDEASSMLATFNNR